MYIPLVVYEHVVVINKVVGIEKSDVKYFNDIEMILLYKWNI
jgi:hypothetical protein